MKPRAMKGQLEIFLRLYTLYAVMGIHKLNILGWRLPNRVTISSRSTGKSYLICIRAREESLLLPMVHIVTIQRAPAQ